MIRAGIIGCGENGWDHFQSLSQIEGVKVTALYDIDPKAPQRWLDKSKPDQIIYIAPSLEALWDQVDAIWVASPPGLHYEHTIAALRAGKHVLCEKPIALELSHADEMIRTAQDNGLTYFVGHSMRFQPLAGTFADIVASGKLGKITSIWSTRLASPSFTKQGWRTEIAMCGGMMIETFTHNIDWMRYVAGEMKEVFMKELTVTPTINFEDHAVGIIEFESGAIGEFHSSWSSGLKRHEWGVIGSDGAASIKDQKQIIISYRNGEREIIEVEKANTKLVEDKLFVAALTQGDPLPFDASDSVKTLEAHIALKLSAREGRPITLPLNDRSLGIPTFAVV